MPIDPVTLSLISRGTMGAAQTIGAMLNQPGERPTMTTPNAITELTNRTRKRSNQTTDGILQQQENTINQGVSDALNKVKRSTGNSSDLTGAMASIQGNANRAKQTANTAYQGRKVAYDNDFNRALQSLGQYESKNQYYNKIAPYEEAVSANNQLMQAGLGNLSDATDMTSTYGAINGTENFSDLFRFKKKRLGDNL